MSFLFSWFKLSICLFNIIWTNTTVEVPLNEDIGEYIDIPEAKLYQNGVWIEDAVAYYQKNGVERTFLTTVNTSYVKTYYIYFEVYFEDYDKSDIEQIAFIVMDITPPKITYLPTFSINYGEKLPNFIDYIRYEDNYDDIDLLKVDIDITQIHASMIGTYDILFYVTDTSLNQTLATTTLTILDQKAPEIILDKPIILDVGIAYKIDDFITIKDNYDQHVIPKILDHELDLYVLGDYEITVFATDMSKNVSMETFLVSVVDRNPPVLVLKTYPKAIDVHTSIDDIDALSYIVSISDNYDDIYIDDIVFYHDIDTSRVGSYKIYYQVSDQSLNSIEKTLDIEVVDQEKPNIEIITPFIFEVFSNPSYLYDHFIVSDNYCIVDDLNITITTSYDINKVGRYDIKIEITDLYKNKTTYYGYIEVVDLIPPTIVELTDIIITDFKQKDLTIYFDATDLYDGDNVNLYVDDSVVNYEQTGIYALYVYATDQSLNQASYQTSVMIIDITNPVLTLKTNQVHINIYEPHDDLSAYIDQASDNYDEKSFEDVLIEGAVDINKVGVYEILYTLRDDSLNETTQSLNIFVNDHINPTIHGSDLNIDMYENIDLLEGLVMDDNVGIYQIYFDPKQIDTSIPGSFDISYLVMDQSGNSTAFTRTIHVHQIHQPYDLKAFIPIIIITIVSISLLYYLYKKI